MLEVMLATDGPDSEIPGTLAANCLLPRRLAERDVRFVQLYHRDWDHHGRCYSLWAAGGGMKPGMEYGQSDDFGYNIVKDPVEIHDFHATLLHLLGIHHEKLTYRFQGRDFRLTDVAGKVVTPLIA